MVVLIGTNIMIDCLLSREDSKSAERIIGDFCTEGKVTGFIAVLQQDSFTDFEDCLQSKCAEDVAADYIITRNPKDFEESTVKVISPAEFVKLLEEN